MALLLLRLAPVTPEIAFQENDLLLSYSYRAFTNAYITDNGRVVRPRNNDDTVSEGQAYALLMAAWLDDQETFDRCYRWTEEHLSRLRTHGDHLLAWRWEDGDVADWTPASDADEDYTYALLLAGVRWHSPTSDDLCPYYEKARWVAEDILRHETTTIDGMLVLKPGTWGRDNEGLIWNPSYFAPAWYRTFYAFFKQREWLQLLDDGYTLLNTAATSVGESRGIGLVPNWCRIVKKEQMTKAEGFSSNHSWDAFRTAWRVCLDWRQFREDRAKDFLEVVDSAYTKLRKRDGALYGDYTHDGHGVALEDDPIAYVPFLATSLALRHTSHCRQAYSKVVQALNIDFSDTFVLPDEYYRNSWLVLSLLLVSDHPKPLFASES